MITLNYYKNNDAETNPDWTETVFSISQAEEALGQLERAIRRGVVPVSI